MCDTGNCRRSCQASVRAAIPKSLRRKRGWVQGKCSRATVSDLSPRRSSVIVQATPEEFETAPRRGAAGGSNTTGSFEEHRSGICELSYVDWRARVGVRGESTRGRDACSGGRRLQPAPANRAGQRCKNELGSQPHVLQRRITTEHRTQSAAKRHSRCFCPWCMQRRCSELQLRCDASWNRRVQGQSPRSCGGAVLIQLQSCRI